MAVSGRTAAEGISAIDDFFTAALRISAKRGEFNRFLAAFSISGMAFNRSGSGENGLSRKENTAARLEWKRNLVAAVDGPIQRQNLCESYFRLYGVLYGGWMGVRFVLGGVTYA